MREELKSNLPLRLALAFDELAPKVAILVLLWSQTLQWRDAWAVRASLHRHWTIQRPCGAGGWRGARHLIGEEEVEECLLCRQKGRSSRRWGKQLGEHELLCASVCQVEKEGARASLPCGQSGCRTSIAWIALRNLIVAIQPIQRHGDNPQPAHGIPSRRPYLRAAVWR